MLRMRRVLLIAINCSGYYSLAIHYLKLYAYRDINIRKGCRIYTAEYDLNTDNNSILCNVAKLSPDVVAFSCYVWNMKKVITLAGEIKGVSPGIEIIFGGQEVTNSTINYLERYPFIDIIVDGEGEKVFWELLHSLMDDNLRCLREVKGIQYRDDNGTCTNPPSEGISDLDEIPSPYLAGAVAIPERSRLGVMLDHVRGCQKRCSFCFEAQRMIRPKAFSVERVHEEIVWAKSHGYQSFHIMDPTLCMNDRRRMESLNDSFKRIYHNEEYWASVEIYAENIVGEIIALLDCYHLFDVGLQTINPVANRNISRHLNVDRFVEGFELLKTLGRNTNIYLIYGLPGDDHDQFMKGVCFAETLAPTFIFLNKLCVLNGTPLRRHAEKYALEYEIEPPYEILSNMTYSYNDIVKTESFANNYRRPERHPGYAPNNLNRPN